MTGFPMTKAGVSLTLREESVRTQLTHTPSLLAILAEKNVQPKIDDCEPAVGNFFLFKSALTQRRHVGLPKCWAGPPRSRGGNAIV
jgi:hypothetical protein